MPPPDRWEAYCPMGKVIPGTKFIAFKVPLKEALLKTVNEEDRFSPSILLTRLDEQGLKLAGVIDLTFTWRYYIKQDFERNSVSHVKIFTKGHEVPSDDVYKQFKEAVEQFSDSGNLIGVHCTHGVNRTGYLICRYMIEKLSMQPQEAIDLFNTARGHNLERENYLEDLLKRKSGEELLGLTPTPPEDESKQRRKPRWHHHREDHPGWRQKPNQDMPPRSNVPFGFPPPSGERHWQDSQRDPCQMHRAEGNFRNNYAPREDYYHGSGHFQRTGQGFYDNAYQYRYGESREAFSRGQQQQSWYGPPSDYVGYHQGYSNDRHYPPSAGPQRRRGCWEGSSYQSIGRPYRGHRK